MQLELCEPLCKIHNYIQNERQRVEYLLSGYDGDGLSVIINVADGHNLLASDIETQLIALSIIVTCVCAPIQMVLFFIYIITNLYAINYYAI